MKTKHVLSSLALGLALTLAMVWLLSSAPGAPIRSAYAQAIPITVTGTHDTGAGSLRQAINDASSGDTIDFDLDTYPATITLAGQLEITKSLTISGPGAEQLAVSGGGSTRVFSITSGASVTVTGLTVRDGSAYDGSGIWCGGNLHLDSVRIVSNTAWGSDGRGGGLAVVLGSAALHGTTVASNTASGNDGKGGGLAVITSSATLSGSTVVSNTTLNSNGYGGGVYVESGSVGLTDTDVISNAGGDDGGGVYVNGENASFCASGGRIANNTGSHGGGVFVSEGSAKLVETKVLNNVSQNDGGGVFASDGSTFGAAGGQIASNEARSGSHGGGVYVEHASATLTGTQVTSNTAGGSGGGIRLHRGASAVLTHVRLLNNEAGVSGGGLAVSGSTATLTDTWVVSNTADGDLDDEGGGGVHVAKAHATFDASGGGIVSNTANRGGGIFVYEGASATLKGTDVTSNRAQGEGKGGGGVYVGDGATFCASGGRIASNGAYAGGGGLFVDYPSSATLTQTDVTSNTAQGGGGVFVHATLRVSGGSMANNEASGQPGHGGAVQVFGPYGSATLTGTRVVSNTAGGAGGGVFVTYGGTATLTETRVVSNTATNGGGLSAALSSWYDYYASLHPSLLVHGGRVAGNAASSGGGVHLVAGSITLTDVEILSNSATLTESGAWSEPPGYGGGMLVLGLESHPGVAALTGTELVGNTASRGGGGICADGGAVSLGTTEIRDNQAPVASGAINVRGGTELLVPVRGIPFPTPGGTISSTTPLTITGDISQTAGTFLGSDHALRLEGALALTGGNFYAPPTFTLTGPFTHTGGTYHQTRDVSGGSDVGFPNQPGGVLLNANGEDLGDTQVELTAGSPCTVVSGAVISHCYVISPTDNSGRDATVTFYYRPDEVPTAQACEEMEAYRWDAGWQPPLWRDARYGRRG